MAVEGDVGPALVEARRLDRGHPARGGQADVFRDVGPLLAAILGDPEPAVVGAGIEHVRVARRLG